VARADSLAALAAILVALVVGAAESSPAIARSAQASTGVACYAPRVADGDTITAPASGSASSG